mmetsp:Transcript_19810/g.52549  ORF Transcript_19810/g.52549 Transcript_19810/m.52549 type:complete len:232 (-) Transcript_19810:759-1454(-)
MLPHDAVIHKHLDGVDENLGVQPRVGRLARVVGDVTHGHLVHLVHPRPDVPVLVVLPHPDLLAAHGHRGVAGEDACLQPAGLFYQVLLRSVGPEHGETEQARPAFLFEGSGGRGRERRHGLCRRRCERRHGSMRVHRKRLVGLVRRRGTNPQKLLSLGEFRPALATTLAVLLLLAGDLVVSSVAPQPSARQRLVPLLRGLRLRGARRRVLCGLLRRLWRRRLGLTGRLWAC